MVLDFHNLSQCTDQGMKYKATNLSYPGDGKMRCVTRLLLKRRSLVNDSLDGTCSKRTVGRPEKIQQVIEQLTMEEYKKISDNGGNNNRFCGNLTRLMHHQCKTVTDSNTKTKRKCTFCGELTYSRCYACPDKPYLHHDPDRRKHQGKKCWSKYHNTMYYGLDEMLCFFL